MNKYQCACSQLFLDPYALVTHATTCEAMIEAQNKIAFDRWLIEEQKEDPATMYSGDYNLAYAAYKLGLTRREGANPILGAPYVPQDEEPAWLKQLVTLPIFRKVSHDKTVECSIWNPYDEIWEESDENLRERIKSLRKK